MATDSKPGACLSSCFFLSKPRGFPLSVCCYTFVCVWVYVYIHEYMRGLYAYAICVHICTCDCVCACVHLCMYVGWKFTLCELSSSVGVRSTLSLEGEPLTLFPETDSIALVGRQSPRPVHFPWCGLQGRTTHLAFVHGFGGWSEVFPSD